MKLHRVFPALSLGLIALAACENPITEPTLEPDLSLIEAPRRADFTLTILHANDGESDLLPGDEFGGVARFARTVDDLREEATNDCEVECAVVLLSSGDNFLAGPEFSASLANGKPFFDAMAQDMIGFDAFAIGNHEFDFGPDVLADYIESFSMTPPPFLSANLRFDGEPRLARLERRGRIASSHLLRVPVYGPDDECRGRGGRHARYDRGWGNKQCHGWRGRRNLKRHERIGIIGATTPELRTISSPRDVEVLQDVAALINRESRMLLRRGATKIILISHLQGIDADLELIPMLHHVDVVIAGGGDELLANGDDVIIPGDEVFGSYPLIANDRFGRDVPVVTTSGSYSYVGRLEVHFARFGRALDWAGGPVRVEGMGDPEIEALIEQPIADAVATLQASIVGATEVELDGRRSQVRTVETNEGNLIADALRWQANELAAAFGVPTADVALQNGGGIRNDAIVPAGDLTEFDTFDFVPFANFVSVVPDISREQFKEILEQAVSAVEFTSGRFAQISGFSFTYDPSGSAQELDESGNVVTAGSRIVDVTLDNGEVLVSGGAVQAGADVTVATIDFLARGGDGYPYRGAPFTSLGATYQQALSNYIQDGLGGTVSAADYPSGGEGRIATVGG